MPNQSGSFVWHDLMTTGYRRSKEVLQLGGVTEINEEMRKNNVPPHWLPSVGVDSVDDTLAKATKLGAKTIASAMDIPGAGRYAIIQDPQGATIAIFAGSGEMSSPGESPKKGNFSWHELTTSDHVAAFDFYSKLFGWEKTSEFDMGPMGIYQMYGQGGVPYGGMMTRTPEMPPPNWLCYINVDDAKAAAATIEREGGKLMMGPMEVPTGGDWIAIATDPQGAATAVHSATPQ